MMMPLAAARGPAAADDGGSGTPPAGEPAEVISAAWGWEGGGGGGGERLVSMGQLRQEAVRTVKELGWARPGDRVVVVDRNRAKASDRGGAADAIKVVRGVDGGVEKEREREEGGGYQRHGAPQR